MLDLGTNPPCKFSNSPKNSATNQNNASGINNNHRRSFTLKNMQLDTKQKLPQED